MYPQDYRPAASPIDYFKKCVTRDYANFDGRARRSEYWYFTLCNAVISFGLQIASFIVAAIAATAGSELLVAIAGGALGLLALAVGLGLLLPGLAVGVRRLHDTGRSGWWLLIAVVPIIGAIALIVFLCQDGTPTANEYGPNPKFGASDDPIEHLEVRA